MSEENKSDRTSISSPDVTMHATPNDEPISQEMELKQLQEEIEKLRQKIAEFRGRSESQPLRDIAIRKNELENINPHVIERRCLSGHSKKVYAVQWSENSRDLVSADKGGTLITWDAYEKVQKCSVNTGNWLMTAAYSPDGELVATGNTKGVVSVFTVDRNLELISEMSEHEGSVSCCRFIDSGSLLTTSADSTCILWDIEQKSPTATFTGHSGEVLSCAISPNKKVFVTGSTDTSAKLWDPRAKTPMVKEFLGHQSDVNSVAFFPSGHGFGTGCEDSSCRFFDLRASRQVNQFSDSTITCGVTSVAFSKSGRILFGGYDDCKAYAWDTVLSKMVQKISGHSDRISALCVSKDGTALATAGWDCQVKVWAT